MRRILQLIRPRTAIFGLGRIFKRRSLITLALTSVAFTAIVYLASQQTGAKPLGEEPLQVVEAYVKASHARDYQQAYRQISSVDQRVMDEKDYVLQHGSFGGFALELAKKLAGDMDLWIIDRKIDADRAHYTVGYRIPVYDEVSAALSDWDQEKLNALSRAEQERLLDRIARLKIAGKMTTITGQETFDLVRDQGRWRILFDWASRSRIKFKVALEDRAGIDVRVPLNDFLAKPDEPFTTVFQIRNRTEHQVVARLVHHIEPSIMENYIDMIACGALRPLVLQPGENRELSSAYLIRDGARASTLAITYEFKVEPLSSTAGPAAKTTKRARAPLKAAARF